jgi:hypothetical protein
MKKIFIPLLFLAVLFSIKDINSEPRRVLLEFCTGTWCGWCPCGHQVIANNIMPAYPNTVVIGYHGASSDPWQNFEGFSVRSLLGFNAYPTAIIDRGNTPSNPYVTYDQWFGRVQTRYNSQPNTQVNLQVTTKSYNSSTRELTATVNATAVQNLTGQYKVQFAVIEGNVVYPQNHYPACGFSGYINDYVHHHIARTMVNGPTGENLNTGQWNQNQTITKNMTKTLDASWVADNCDLIIFVYRDSSVLALANVEQANEVSVTAPLGIANQNNIPANYSLSQNYPNPFNPTTNIVFTIPKNEHVSLKFYDMMGREVATYLDAVVEAGTYKAEVDASGWASGIYFYTLKTDNFVETKKMMLIK